MIQLLGAVVGLGLANTQASMSMFQYDRNAVICMPQAQVMCGGLGT